MKKSYLILCCLLSVIPCLKAQTYRPIPATGAVWKVMFENFGIPGSVCSSGYYLYSAGTVTIGSLDCVEIREGDFSVCHTSGSGSCSLATDMMNGFIYQDTTGVVYRVEGGVLAGKLFDFSLMPGDTMNGVFRDGEPVHYICSSVSSVTYADGILRKKMNMAFTQGAFTFNTEWVEGIGDILKGPLPKQNFVESYFVNICYSETPGLNLFANPTFYCADTSCSAFVVSRTEPEHLYAAHVYPNPSSGEFQIVHPEVEAVTVKIYDAQGRCVLSQSFAASASVTIDLSPQTPGVYHAVIHAGDQVRHAMLVLR